MKNYFEQIRATAVLCFVKQSEIGFYMKSQIYGIVGIVLGLIAFLMGLGQRTELAFVLLIGGLFLFGCGLVAAAIGARK